MGALKRRSQENTSCPRGLAVTSLHTARDSATVLGRASCEDCRKITRGFETVCQQGMFGHLRTRVGLTVQGNAPPTKTGRIMNADGSFRDIVGKPNDFPAFLILPLFHREASYFLPPGSPHEPVKGYIYKVVLEEDPASPFLGENMGLNFNLDVDAYQRMLTKIALREAIVKYGPDAFTPLVCDFIRGKEHAIGRYVFGYPLEEEHPPLMGETHMVRIREHEIAGRLEVCRGLRSAIRALRRAHQRYPRRNQARRAISREVRRASIMLMSL